LNTRACAKNFFSQKIFFKFLLGFDNNLLVKKTKKKKKKIWGHRLRFRDKGNGKLP